MKGLRSPESSLYHSGQIPELSFARKMLFHEPAGLKCPVAISQVRWVICQMACAQPAPSSLAEWPRAFSVRFTKTKSC